MKGKASLHELKPAAAAAERVIFKGARVCVALSGGVDSVALLHFLHERLPAGTLTAVHVEHGIRGETSRRDARHCKTLCASLGVPLSVVEADVPGAARASGNSIETEARLLRRTVFMGLIRDGAADLIATAHHAGDQTESILLHILRGAGLKGLVGMSERDGYYVRPFLSLSRDEISAYAAAHRLAFVEDETNGDDSFDRNYLRLNVLPLLRKRWDADGQLAALKKSAEAALDFIDSRLDDGAVVFHGDTACIAVDALVGGDALASMYVFRAAEGLCGSAADLERKHIDAVIKLARAQNGKRIDLKNGLAAAKEYTHVTLYKKSAAEPDEIPFAPGVTPFSDGTLFVRQADNLVEPGVLRFDGDAVPPGAVVRFRREGDWFRPFGGGRRKLKEYLIDKKIPLRIRDRLPVVAVGAEVLIVVGVEIAESLRLSGRTVNALEIEYL